MLVAALVAVPAAWQLTTKERLADLQLSQNANATDASNLSLGRIDFSSRQAVVLHLPRRMSDVLTRPYPWQIQNTSQRLGVIGTVLALILLALLLRTVVARRGEVMRRAGPLVYPAVALLASYSLSAGNAGTAFRYRTQIVAFVICLLVVLWPERLAKPSISPVDSPEGGGRTAPILARS
jgi:hypothetical protein